MFERGLELWSSSMADRFRLRKEKAGLRETKIGDGNWGDDEGRDESSESEDRVSGENMVRSAAGGLEGAVVDEALSLEGPCCLDLHSSFCGVSGVGSSAFGEPSFTSLSMM